MANQTVAHTDSKLQCPDVTYYEVTPEKITLTRKGKVIELPRSPLADLPDFCKTVDKSIAELSKYDHPVIRELVVKLKKIRADYLKEVSRRVRRMPRAH